MKVMAIAMAMAKGKAKAKAKAKEKAETDTERIGVRFWRGLRNGCHFKGRQQGANHPILTQGGCTGHPCLVIGGKIDWFSFVFSLTGFESATITLDFFA